MSKQAREAIERCINVAERVSVELGERCSDAGDRHDSEGADRADYEQRGAELVRTELLALRDKAGSFWTDEPINNGLELVEEAEACERQRCIGALLGVPATSAAEIATIERVREYLGQLGRGPRKPVEPRPPSPCTFEPLLVLVASGTIGTGASTLVGVEVGLAGRTVLRLQVQRGETAASVDLSPAEALALGRAMVEWGER